MNKKIKIVFSLFAILFGIFFFIYGGFDDSPGGQLLGFLAVVAGVIGIIKVVKKSSK